MAWDELYTEKTLSIGTHWTKPTSLWDNKTHHSIEYVITGDGSVSITPYTSISGREWVSNGAKASGVTKTSGPDSDGINNIPLSLYPSEIVKFKLVVTGDSVAVSLWFTQK